ncbi:MAG: hypothetical protein WC708_01505 [Lentisphaeria bacterium]|jgi:hypothetical protein
MKYKKFQLSALKTEIKRLANDGRALNKEISSTDDIERHVLRREKALIGRKAREYLLAYAFLRGIPYKVLEGENNASYSYYMTEAMLKIIKSHLPENECDVSILTNWVFPPKSEAA